MESQLKKYFLFLFPYLIATFLMLIAESVPPQDTAEHHLLYAFPRLSALANLAFLPFLIGLYRLSEISRDKLIIAFACIEILFAAQPDFLKVFFGYAFDLSTSVLELLLAIAKTTVCAWMLIRTKNLRIAAITLTVLLAPLLIHKMSDFATPITEFFSGEFFLRLWEYTISFVLPLSILGFYLHYTAGRNAPNKNTPTTAE